MRFQEITPSMILLLVGGILAVLVQLPVVNEFLPLVSVDTTAFEGTISLMGGAGDYDTDYVGGWTMIGLDGIIFWILMIIGGILCIIPAVNKFQPFLPEMELPLGGLGFWLAAIGCIIQILVILLIFIGDAEDLDAYGLSMMDMPTDIDIGFGFYVMAIAAIVCIVGAVLLWMEEQAA